MVFSSHLFLFYFLPLALLLYYLVPRRAKHLLLTVVSYIFYGWANPLFTVLLLVSTLIDYVCRPRHRARRLPLARADPDCWRRAVRGRGSSGSRLIVSICSNLCPARLLQVLQLRRSATSTPLRGAGSGMPGIETALQVTLPLGISFYTFQSMSYTIDVYRGHAQALASFIDFACYRLHVPAARRRPDHPLPGSRRPADERGRTRSRSSRGAWRS